MTTDVDLLSAHRRVWDAKPRLRDAYRRYYDMLLEGCPKDAVVLELGCGIGGLAERARELGYERWITTDYIASPAARLRCDAAALPFRAGSVDRIVFVDVLHHLPAPMRFFEEAARVLRPGGEIVSVEPWITPLGYMFYRFIHPEGYDSSRDPAAPFATGDGKSAYEGDGGLTTVICRKTDAARWRTLGFQPPRLRVFNDFAYVTTGGLRPIRAAPSVIFAATRAVLDELLAPLALLLGIKARVWWRRLDPPTRGP
jgi:SAM-dependent methyltransferase